MPYVVEYSKHGLNSKCILLCYLSSVLLNGWRHAWFLLITERLHMMLKEDGGIKALLGMARSGSSDVVAQVARGLANFAKCESRGILQGW